MAIIPMQKVAIITLKSLKEDVLHLLHNEGVLEVSDVREGTSPVDHTEVKFRKAELEFAIATLLPFASKNIRSTMNKKPSKEDIVMAALHTDIRAIIDRVHALEKKEHEARKALHEQLTGNMVADNAVSGVNEAAYFIGTVPAATVKTSVTESNVPPSQEEQAKTTLLQRDLDTVHDERMKLAEELPSLSRALVYLRWLDEKQMVREAMRETDQTVTLFGWVAKKNVAHLEKKLLALSNATAILKVKPDEHETIPVQLKNSKILTPFESVTKLYGLPQSNEMDPTPYLSLFFIIFFGLCLTDAGYGLVIALVMGGYLLHIRKSVSEAPLFWLLMLSGIVTFFVSIPFGGWFGVSPDHVPAYLTKPDPDGTGRLFIGQIWNLSDQTGITFLQNLALALGIIHLTFGIVLGVISKIRGGNIAIGLWMDGTALLFIGAVLTYFFGPAEYQQLFSYGIIGTLVLMVWGKGHGNSLVKRPIFGFLQTLNFFLGMMGNILSYLRILALGLVTGALAFTVNLVAEQISAFLPWFLAIPVAIVIYVLGHLANIVLNTLGAFIHSGRLQFVEFFSQFFEGGGRPFRPFSREA